MLTVSVITRRRHLRVLLLAGLAAMALVAGPGGAPASADTVDLSAHFNNRGISHDPFSASDFDGGGFAYSGVALRLEGLVAGESVQADGMVFTWPDRESGQTDNVVGVGQTIPLTAPDGAQRIGFLGAGANGTQTAQVTFTYSYVDEEGPKTADVVVPVTFSDWTLAAGQESPHPSNVDVAETLFRMANDTQPQTDRPHIFMTSVPLQQDMTLESMTLPSTEDFHVFAVSIA